MPPTPAAPEDEMRDIKAAAKDLLYPSESDEPFDAFHWHTKSAPPADARSEIAIRDPGRAIAEVPVDGFFADLKDADDADQFAALRKALEKSLKGLRIFRVGDGETNVDLYLIGQTTSGAWAGLHTVSVET